MSWITRPQSTSNNSWSKKSANCNSLSPTTIKLMQPSTQSKPSKMRLLRPLPQLIAMFPYNCGTGWHHKWWTRSTWWAHLASTRPYQRTRPWMARMIGIGIPLLHWVAKQSFMKTVTHKDCGHCKELMDGTLAHPLTITCVLRPQNAGILCLGLHRALPSAFPTANVDAASTPAWHELTDELVAEGFIAGTITKGRRLLTLLQTHICNILTPPPILPANAPE